MIDAVATHTGMEDVFRLRSIGLCRVDECRTATTDAPDRLEGLSVFVHRLEECGDLAELTRRGLESIDDLFGFPHSMLLRIDESERSLFVVAHHGYGDHGAAAEVPVGEGVIGIAAKRRRQVLITHMTRSRNLLTAGVSRPAREPAEIPLPGLDDAQSLVSSPLLLHEQVIGVLFLDSPEPGRFGATAAKLIEILAGHLAVHIGLREAEADEEAVSAPSGNRRRSRDDRPSREVWFYDQDGTVLLDGDYVIKGVPGRILFVMLDEHQRTGRSQFSNRELRLSNAVGLPPGNDNLEARLLALRRRLDERNDPIRLNKVGRGQLELVLHAPIELRHHSSGDPKTLRCSSTAKIVGK